MWKLFTSRLQAFRHRISLDRFSSADTQQLQGAATQSPCPTQPGDNHFRPFFYLKSTLAAKKAQIKDILLKQVNNLQSKTQTQLSNKHP